MKQPKNPVLFVSHYVDPLRTTFLPLANRLAATTARASLVVADSDRDGRMHAVCREAGVPVIADPDGESNKRSTESMPDAASEAAACETSSETGSEARHAGRFRAFRHTIRGLRRMSSSLAGEIRRLTDFLVERQPAALVLPDDRTMLACRWIRAAELAGTPTMAIQWAATHRAETLVQLRAALASATASQRLSPSEEQALTHLVPEASRRVKDQPIWWMPPEDSYAYWRNGAFPRVNPWTFGGGNTDLVAVLGPEWKRRLTADEVSPEKVIATGHPAQDEWLDIAKRSNDAERRSVLRALGLPENRRLVTVISPALTFWQAGGSLQGDGALQQVSDGLRHVVRSISELGDQYAAVLKLHPRDPNSTLSDLADEPPGPVAIVRDFDVQRLIASSAAVCCEWSTTSMLAQAVDTPTLMFDFRRSISADVWRGAPGFARVSSREDFLATLRNCLECEKMRARLAEERREFVRKYLQLDGRATERLVESIERLAARDRNAGRRCAA